MTPHDNRHGTYAGYSKHYRDGEPPCAPCRIAKNERIVQIRRPDRDESPNVLDEGAWRFDPFKRIQVWVPNPDAPAVEEPELVIDLPDGIACTCGAKVTEACHSRSGLTVNPHKTRRIPRQCPCGTTLTKPKRRFCDACGEYRRTEGKKTNARQNYAKRREAA